MGYKPPTQSDIAALKAMPGWVKPPPAGTKVRCHQDRCHVGVIAEQPFPSYSVTLDIACDWRTCDCPCHSAGRFVEQVG